MEKSKTDRGFDIVDFKDAYGSSCSLQKSSLATEDAIWFGINCADPMIMANKLSPELTGWVKYPIIEDVHLTTRMHLKREDVARLLPILQKFVDTGDI